MRFRFRTIPFLVTIALVALGVSLGNWQIRRAAEKTALQATLHARMTQAPLTLDGGPVDPAALAWRRVIVSGAFIPNWTLFLDNQPLAGRSGFILVAPFRIAGSNRVVLVERGWAARDPAAHDRVPQAPPPAGVQMIEGMATVRAPRAMQLGAPAPLTPGAIVQNLDPAGFARASRLDVLPVMVEQTGGSTPALVRTWPGPDIDVGRHKGYAFQWYALAAMAFIYFVITGFRRASKQG
jgi:surfeit locus 1 family protein